MIGSISLKQAGFFVEAGFVDSIEDYPEDDSSSVGFPPGSYPDNSVITLHKILRRLSGTDVPEQDRL